MDWCLFSNLKLNNNIDTKRNEINEELVITFKLREIQIGYKARDIAMKREEANYFSGIVTESSAAENNNTNKIHYDS